MEFVLGDEDNLGSLTEETAFYVEEGGDFRIGDDIPEDTFERTFKPEETIDIVNEEEEHVRVNSVIFEGLLADTRLTENTTDSVSRDLRTQGDILECMTVTSSPDEQITNDLLEEVSGDLENNVTFTSEENDFGHVHVTRNPTPIIVCANHKFAVCSRYLSAPLASCHELCKSGHKYLLEDPKRCILGTIGGVQPLMRTTGDSISLPKVETKKKALLRRSSLPGIIVKNDSGMHIKNMNHSKKDFKCFNLKRVQCEVKPPWASTSGYSSSRTKTDIQAGKKMAVCSPKLVENPSQTVKEINARKETGSHSRLTKERAKEPIHNPVTSKMNTRIHKNLQSFDRSKNQCNSKEDKINRSFDVPEKTLFMIKPSMGKNPEKGALKFATSNKSFRNTEKAKEPTVNSLSPLTPRTLKRSPIVKPKLHKNIKSSYCLKNQNNPEETKITGTFNASEKTLYMIEPNTDKKLSKRASKLASSNKSSYMVEPNSDKKRPRRASLSASSNKRLLHTPRASHGSKNEGLEYKQKVIKIDPLSPLSRPASISTVSIAQEPYEPWRENQKDLDSMETKEIDTTTADEASSVVVKFRRGTVVSLQVEDTSPERLKFRQGRIVGDDQNDNDEAEATCLKKTKLTDDEPQGTEPETPKVLLRHQQAVDRKGNVDLNNVIEETASKLVKSSKSKVKALVGAFETVISLHDRKPLLATRVA